ncbi:FecR family protein [Bradyrhizobium sp. 930_D9_N1_4]|uniref:FecR family protein n=1 Tax=Bradyrhizobium sp. 930_D9_N1_4 TaxID=3240374 RepID=UPI003F8B9C0F
MNDAEPDQQRLLDEAIDLVIRLQNDPENEVVLDMIRAWRARSPAHQQAWSRVARAHGASGKILEARRRSERRQNLGLSRRNLVIGGLVSAGAAAAGYAVLPDVLVRSRADVMTAKAETRRVELPDGSIATLGPVSALALDFNAVARRLELLSGMAFFEVAREAQRPFVVAAQNLTSTARDAAFEVFDDAGVLSVSVERGAVELRAPAFTSDGPMNAKEWLTFDPSSRKVDRGNREAGQIAVWRDRLIVAEQDTVSALVVRIGRWIPGRIVMADPFIGAQKVSGVFDLTHPMRALEAVLHPTGAQVRQVSSFLTVISPI